MTEIEMIEKVRHSNPYAPLVVKENVGRNLALLITQEGSITMPGVGVEIVPRRTYPTGELTAQVIGFLGKIPPEQVEAYRIQGYNTNVDRIGYAGIEAAMEEGLRGVPGRKNVEKDFLGKEIRTVGEVIQPVAGDNVYLTLDLELQKVADAALRMLQVDELGLDRLDRELLGAICERFDGGPVGLSTLAVSVGEETDTVEDVYEPYLLQQGLIVRTPRGRVATRRAYTHLGLIPPVDDTLFPADS